MKAITGKFEGINKSNWSGETIDITVKDGKFQMYDYDWEIKDVEETFLDSGRSIGGWFKLVSGEDWIDQAIFLDAVTEEAIVNAAVAWIANYV